MAVFELPPLVSAPLPLNTTRFRRAADALERNPGAVVASFTALYFVITIVQASLRLLWFDEFITFYIAKLNSVGRIWHALAMGTDPNPPLSHMAEMWSMRLFGDSSVAVRLPAILASYMGLACLWLFLRRRLPVVYAAAGTLFFMATAAFDYSYESRSYPFMLGFAMLSLLAWRWTVESKHKYWSAALLAAALAAGISSNYFAVLAFFPVAAGELTRNISRRKLEWRTWIALALGGIPLLLYLPLINHAIATFAPHAWNKPTADIIPDSYTEMIEYVLIVAVALIGMAAFAWSRQRRTGAWLLRPDPLPRHEAAAVLVNMLYPVIGYGIAVARAGMISPRFLIPMAYGFAIASAALGYRLFSRWRSGGLVLLVLLFAWVVARESFVAESWLEQKQAFHRVQEHLPYANTIAVSDSLLVLPLYYYSTPEIAKRIVFPVDFAAIRQWKREDSPEENLWAGRKGVFPVPIVPLKELERTTPNFLIVTTLNNWLIWDFAAQGRPAHLLPIWPHAGDIGGFTPLAHAEPFYFVRGPEFEPALYAARVFPRNRQRRMAR